MTVAIGRDIDTGDADVLVLLRGRNGEIVRRWLGESVRVLDSEAGIPHGFDLCILDAASLVAYIDELTARKEEAAGTFLPYLLLVREMPSLYRRPEVQQVVDEVITIPVEPAELGMRIENLLLTRRQSAELRDRKENELSELRRQNERLDQFADIVSHDLRNPLTVVGGAIELAAETGELEHLDLARDGVRRMHELVESVLELARKGRLVDETEPVELETVARSAWAYVPHGESRLDVAGSYVVEADPKRFGELLSNLFRNSVEHGSVGADDDGTAGGATISLGPLFDESERPEGFFVEDDGPGIPEENREAALKFGFTTDDGGTGFGLAIVDSIAGAHGWAVTVGESEAGGARFEFRHDAVAG